MKKLLSLISLFLTLSVVAESQVKWKNINTWVYQLCNYKDDKLDALAKAKFDLAVIDLSRDGKASYFTANEISMLKASNKIVLSYFEIGAIEDYRPEWGLVADDLKAGAVNGWPKEQYVKYWDEQWWAIVKSRIDQSLKAGFDGVYLDMLSTYSEIPNSKLSEEDRAAKMVNLVLRISKYAKSKNAQFKIVPQNCPELYTRSFWDGKPDEKYLNAIDGLGFESPFYLAHDKPAKQKWCAENRDNAVAIRAKGKLVLSVDYAKKQKSTIDSYSKQRALGFVPYVSVQNLDIIAHKPRNSK